MTEDSFVNPDLEQYGQEQYNSLRPRIHEMRSRALAVIVTPDGMLAREDERTNYSPISYQVRFQLQLAAEHLVALDHLVIGHGLPNYAGYVLIRAALETSAMAYWLLQSNVSNRRVLRALRTAMWDQRDSAEFTAAAGHTATEWDLQRHDHLDRLRSNVKGLHQSSLDVPRLSHTDMLTAVGRGLKISQQPSTLLAWRLCSSLAHGNSAAAVMALQHRQVADGNANVHSARSSWALVSALVRTALETFDGAVSQYQQRASLT